MRAAKQPFRFRLREAREQVVDDPRRALRALEKLSRETEQRPEIHGEVLVELAYARRVSGDREGAHEAFRRASAVEESPLKLGHVFCQWALLELDRHRHDEALRRVERGLELIEAAEPSHRDVAQGLLSRAIVLSHAQRYDDAERDNRSALELIHPRKDADLHFRAMQNLSFDLLTSAIDPCRVERALRTLDEANKVLRRYRIRLKTLQNACVLWVRGHAFRKIGADERAESLFVRARDILFEIGALSHWTSLSLDLIEIHMHYARWGLVKKTLGEILDHAQNAEVLAAVAVFYDAIRADAVEVTGSVLERVYAAVHGGHRQPPDLVLGETDDSEPIGF